MNLRHKRLVVVSNRLPVAIREDEQGSRLRSASGGLVTALAPIMQENRGLWIGWLGRNQPGNVDQMVEQFNQKGSYTIKPLQLTPEEMDLYYEGFSNSCIWPLFHDLISKAHFNLPEWKAYSRVNERFSEVIAGEVQPGDFIWVHDYHLMRVASTLRKRNVHHPLAYFHHIPFPAPDIFRRLPWREDILNNLLDFDLLGFQSMRDRSNFIATVRELVKGSYFTRKRRHTLVHLHGRTVRVGNYPISIDYHEFDQAARASEVRLEMKAMKTAFPAETLILGLDRLDYTKGIPERFLAFERMLELHPELLGKVSLIQVVVPSRTGVQRYKELKEELDSLTGRINGRFSEYGYVPIYYYFKHLNRTELLAHYRTCSVALITPLRDGMNLVAKEYAASQTELDGSLILSEFTGSAEQLARGAIIVNPYDLEGVAEAIYHAITLPQGEKRERMRAMRNQVRKNDVHRWVGWFTDAFSAS